MKDKKTREQFEKIVFDALVSSSERSGSAVDHIVDALMAAGAVIESKNSIKKKKYGVYGTVELSDEEFDKLRADYPKLFEAAIEVVDEYICTSGKKYKNHYLVIKKWGIEAAEEKAEREQKRKERASRFEFTLDDIFEKPM